MAADANTVFLLESIDEANASATFADSSSNTWALNLNGTPQHSINVGSPSGLGTSAINLRSGTLNTQLAFSDVWQSDFTLEFWCYQTDGAAETVLGQGSSSDSDKPFWIRTSTSLQAEFDIFRTVGSISVGVWNHFAFERVGARLYGYINGVKLLDVALGTYSYTGVNSLIIGNGRGSTSVGYNGYLQQLRISDTARYGGANFTPPNTFFSASSGPTIITSQAGADADSTLQAFPTLYSQAGADASSTLDANVLTINTGQAGADADSTLSAIGAFTAVARATLDSDSSLQIVGEVTATGRAKTEGTGDIAAYGGVTITSAAGINGDSDARARGVIPYAFPAKAEATSELTTRFTFFPTARALLEGQGDIAAQGLLEALGKALTDGTGDIALFGTLTGFSFGGADALSTLSATGTKTVRSDATANSESALQARGVRTVRAMVRFEGISNLETNGQQTQRGHVRFDVSSSFNAFGGLDYTGRALVPANPLNFDTLSDAQAREGEHYLLPDWYARDGNNQAFLEALWHAVAGVEPEFAASMLELETTPYPYLDRHGDVYGVGRNVFELDDAYRARIISEVATVRSTADGLERYVQEQTGIDIRVIETRPWENFNCRYHYLDGTWTLDGSVTFRCEDYRWHYLDGTWTLDGSVNLSAASVEALDEDVVKRYAPATFRVDILDANGEKERAIEKVTAAKRAIEKARAAGMIPMYGLELFFFAYQLNPASRLRKKLERSVTAYFGNQHLRINIAPETGETTFVDTVNNRGSLPSPTPQPAPPESIDALATERYSQGYASGYGDGLDKARRDLIDAGILSSDDTLTLFEQRAADTLADDSTDATGTGTDDPTTDATAPVIGIPVTLESNYSAGFDAGYRAGFGDGSSNGPRYPSFPGEAGRFFLQPSETNQPIFRVGGLAFTIFNPNDFYEGEPPTISRLRKHLVRVGDVRMGFASRIRAFDSTPILIPTSPDGETNINIHVDNRDDTYDGYSYWRLSVDTANVFNELEPDAFAIARLALYGDDNTIDKTQDTAYFESAFASDETDATAVFTTDLLPQWQAEATQYPIAVGAQFKVPLLIHAYRVWVVEKITDEETGEVLERYASPRSWTLQASHDGELWTDVHRVTDETQWAFGEDRLFIIGNHYG